MAFLSNPIYCDYDLLKEALSKAAPHLTLCTTREQWTSLRANGGAPSHIVIEMANSDNKRATGPTHYLVKWAGIPTTLSSWTPGPSDADDDADAMSIDARDRCTRAS